MLWTIFIPCVTEEQEESLHLLKESTTKDYHVHKREAWQLFHFCALHGSLLRWHPEACQLCFSFNGLSNWDPNPLANWAESQDVWAHYYSFWEEWSSDCHFSIYCHMAAALLMGPSQFFSITVPNRCLCRPELALEFNITGHTHLHSLLLALITIDFPRSLLSVGFLFLGFLNA